MSLEHVDVLIVGAGLSGIGAGVHLQANCPGKTYAILEARDCIGGTWDLFRYPGIRSDSDMYTLGYSFRPWEEAKSIADGPSILEYVRQTASDHGIDKHIHFGHRVLRAEFSTAGRPLARDRAAQRHAGDGAVQRRLPVHVQRLLPLRRGLHAGVPRHGALRRAHRPPAAVDRGHRVRRQARRRDRQRGDRDHARPLDGRAGRARDDAAALAQLRHLAARRRSHRPRAAARAARKDRICDLALEERAAHDAELRSQPAQAARHEGAAAQGAGAPAARRGTTSTSTSSPATTPGTSACAWSPTATSSRRSAAAARRS